MLTLVKQKIEDCHKLSNDVGKMLIFSLIQLITTVGGEATTVGGRDIHW